MSASSSRNRTVSISSGRSSRGKATQMQDFTMSPSQVLRFFEPCAATASMFLYAQGSSIVCCHHDTLTIERRFSRHSDEIQLLAVDTQSEKGAGRLVVSYDTGQTAIVWDLMTGDEVARFASYEHLTTAAWMRNGNVAFGNTQGNIILFEPGTSEHISTRTIDQIAVTSLAPAADCRTFAIGYQNGSLLIATLQPRFTILHNLSTSRGPSPIVTLCWHASSSRQKSDMLAVQTYDGDLRVWSVAKSYNANDPAKIVRILKRTENYLPGPNWMGWSKNGRIIQFSDNETLSWDVRTKHVTHDSIPTLEHVRGLAVYGPGASLFTLGANNTVQQFDLNSPAIIVANVQHPANLLPPSPPVSIEEQGEKSVTTITSDTEVTGTVEMSISESDDDHLSPFARMARGKDTGTEPDRYDTASPVSSRSGLSRTSAGSKTPSRYPSSLMSRGMTENTYISAGSSMKSSAVYRAEPEAYSASTLSSASVTSSSRSKHKPSRLRNEVLRSPDDSTKVHDLFKYTRSRLSDIPYKHPPVQQDSSRLTNDDLRRQMLSTIFGWNKEVKDLIRDEMSRHRAGSPSRILLSKWLGDIDADVMAASAESMTSSDWMLLALSGMGGQGSQHKLGRAYVQRLLEKGDVHAAATIMIGMGDHNDAIEIYISHKRYMEALILACLFFPSVWERQSGIIKKWGEWAVMHGQQQLAVRCFASTGRESSEPWTSPSAAQITFQSMTPSIPEILSPPLSPPGMNRGPQRSIAKTSALKLITSFGDQGGKSKFFSGTDDGQTPIAAGVTPIAESAVSPGPDDVATAFIRPTQRSQFNTPNSARSNTSAFSRGRLPSIGEIPQDAFKAAGELPTPPTDRDERNPTGSHLRMSSAEQENLAASLNLERAATASPMMMRGNRHKHKEAPPPSPDPQAIAKIKVGSNRRNGSRDRIPVGVELQLRAVENPFSGEVTSPEQSVSSSTRFHWPSRRRGPGSVASSVTSNSSAGRGMRSNTTSGRPSDYIHSLDAAQHYAKKQRSRHNSRERQRESSRGRDGSRERKSREPSEERGRAPTRGWTKPKRSPTSPIPMSPEDLINLSTPRTSEDADGVDPATVRKASRSRQKPASRTSSQGSRRKSPDSRPRPLNLETRGRSKGREGSVIRSPSSPLPMSANAKFYQGSDDEADYKKAVKEKEKFRTRHGGNRSSSRGGSSRPGREDRRPLGAQSPEAARLERSESQRGLDRDAAEAGGHVSVRRRVPSREHAGDLKAMKDERQRKKEEAARELEERRKSLAQRPQVPTIPHPNDISPALARTDSEEPTAAERLPSQGRTTDPPRSMYARTGANIHIGLPATPKAMRLILESENRGVPGVPPIPASFAQRVSPNKVSPNNSPKGSPGKQPESDLTLLPSTVYQPPVRVNIPRSMSAPIPDDPNDALRSGVSRGKSVRQSSRGEARGIDEVMGVRRGSHDDQAAPPAPPILKELQHLATPPPPPPAPLPHIPQTEGRGSATIEIVMNEDEAAVAVPPADTTVPVLTAPAPPSARGRHSRGRSVTENSIASRISKATERLRSVSRSRRDAKTKSPTEPAPYESIPPSAFAREPVRSPPVTDTSQLPTGLHESELI